MREVCSETFLSAVARIFKTQPVVGLQIVDISNGCICFEPDWEDPEARESRGAAAVRQERFPVAGCPCGLAVRFSAAGRGPFRLEAGA